MMIPAGYGGFINEKKVVAVAGGWQQIPHPIRRSINIARENGKLIDITHGRRTKTVAFTSSGHVILIGVGVNVINERFKNAQEGKGESA